jgi:uncharacterized protein (TIGR03083 family)
VALPAGLRERVMAASVRARGGGRPVPDVPELSGAEAFGRAADALDRVLCALADEDWSRPALRGLDVQGLVGHLTGVEEDTHRALAGDPAVADDDHVSSTQAAADRQAGRLPARTRAEWRGAADATLRLVRGDGQDDRDDREMAMHGMRLSLRALLIVRAFELWVHENDIRRAAGLPPSAPDAPALRLMCELAARLLPYAAVRSGLTAPADVRLVLTGPGGGTWDVEVGERPPEPARISIVADAVGFCRLAANRATPAELGAHITGDRDRATGLLAAASTLALD